MLFNSHIFILCFLPSVLVGYHLLKKYNLKEVSLLWLSASSLFFYAWWNPIFLILILSSILVNFGLGKLIISNFYSQKILILGILFNLGLIVYYKYSGFLVFEINSFFNLGITIPKVILPLAISFFTFQQISYLIDLHKNKNSNYPFLHYILYVTFFPQLIAGPIVHHRCFMPQLNNENKKTSLLIGMGISIFFVGLSKKVLIADNLSPIVAESFNPMAVEQLTFISAWVGAISYTFQLYFDFSGYSDMATGLGIMFGFFLPINFNSPYKATSISDFWRRWHITLSEFLREYLYIPLGGNRVASWNVVRNLFVTMFLGGLWHGAGWTFVFWGLLHGLYLSINYIWAKVFVIKYLKYSYAYKFFSWLITFVAIIVSWVIFRADNLDYALKYLNVMFEFSDIILPERWEEKLVFIPHNIITFSSVIYFNKVHIIFGISLFSFVLILPNTQTIFKEHLPPKNYKPQYFSSGVIPITWNPTLIVSFLFSVLGTICVINMYRLSEFLYFQF